MEQTILNTIEVKITNIVFHSPDKLANALALHKAFNMKHTDCINFVKANEIRPTSILNLTIDKDINDIVQILDEYHITCDMTLLNT